MLYTYCNDLGRGIERPSYLVSITYVLCSSDHPQGGGGAPMAELSSALRVGLNLYNAEATTCTFIHSTREQRILKIIQTLSCWYSLNSSRSVLSDEYSCARVSVIFFYVFYIILYWQISHQQH